MNDSDPAAPKAQVVDMPISPEEHARRATAEANRLASLAPGEWLLWIDGSAKRLGIPRATLEAMVKEIFKRREKEAKAQAEDQQRQQRAEKQRATAQKELVRKSKAETQKEGRIRKEEERRGKELAKELASIGRLPQVAHELRLQELAKRLDVDINELREQLQFFIVPDEVDHNLFRVEPWDKAVDALALLHDLIGQMRRFVVISDEGVVAVACWILFAWCHEVARHSPCLLVTSADPSSGKSRLLRVVGQLCPRPNRGVEMTPASFYRGIHHKKPTLVMDEADTVFLRGAELQHLINESWEHPCYVERTGPGGRMQRFSIWCPKVIGMRGMALPETTATRCIVVKMRPRLECEKIEPFFYADDESFQTLRRKCLRWAADNVEQLKQIEPTNPPGVTDRAAANWRLQFIFADLAGDDMPKRVRAAALKLLDKSKGVRLSTGQRLLLAIEEPLKAHGELTSKDLLAHLHAEPEWANFRGRGKLNEWQLAKLLSEYEVGPTNLHPIRGSTKTLRGYCYEDFEREQVFERHIPRTARNHTTAQAPKKSRK